MNKEGEAVAHSPFLLQKKKEILLSSILQCSKDALRGEGQRSRDAENFGAILVGGRGLEVDRDTRGDVAGNGDAVSDVSGSDGDGARVSTSGQSGAEITRVAVDVDSPWL